MTSQDFVLALVVNAAELPGLLIARHLIDRIGRRNTVALMYVLAAAMVPVIVESVMFGQACPWQQSYFSAFRDFVFYYDITF